MSVYSQDPILSHLVGRYWYYHTGGGHQVSGHGTGQDGYHADEGHGLQDKENDQDHHEALNEQHSKRNHETHEVLPASTYKLNKLDAIPNAPLKLQLNQANFSSSFEIGAKYSDKTGPVKGMPSSSPIINDSRFETEETTQHHIPSSFPEIENHSSARVKELRHGSGRIIRAKRLVASGAELKDWFEAKMVLFIFLVWFMI